MADDRRTSRPAGDTGYPSAHADADTWMERHQEALQQQFPLPDLAQLRAQAQARAEKRRRRRVATGLALAAGLIGTLAWVDPAYRSETFVTAVGEQRRLAMPDGSMATLDSNAALQMRWHVRSRRAHLDRGRAYFDVARATYRPFIVQVADAQVQVIGTRFDVERAADGLTVALHEGRVDVTLHTDTVQQQAYRLSAGMALTAHGSQVMLSRTQGDTPDWSSGQLVFERMPLGQALAVIQRYRPEHIHLTDPGLANERVSGVFQIAQLHQVFDLLPLVWPVKVIRQAGDIHVLPLR